MRKVAAGFIPFILMHLLCCGALLFFLVTSGYLLILRQEGTNKLFLVPAILFWLVLFGLYRYHGNYCDKKEYKASADHIVSFLLYMTLSMVLEFIFMIYVFIPWWIPNYRGGILLP